MAYVPIGDADRRKMLEAIGVERVEDLFTSIPEKYRRQDPLGIPRGLSEPELRRRLGSLAKKNLDVQDLHSFLGAGAYRHEIPSVVSHLTARSEFYSSYTPYQPEISQGTLQAIFEYQTLICQLTGMEVANASLYDGASALAEGILLSHRVRKKRRVLLANSVHPHYLQVARAYTRHLDLELEVLPFGKDGRIDPAVLESALRDDSTAVVLQSPNVFGIVEDTDRLSKPIRTAGALLISVVTDPVCLGALRPPGEFGADVVLGEAQALGGGLVYGGPYLGFLATRESYLREIPGRLAGRTEDGKGNPGYVLTLATREQHIRREKASSNICTNQGLCALSASIFLASLGREGIREMALQNLHKAHYAKHRLAEIDGCRLRFAAETFHEFVLELPEAAATVHERLYRKGFLAGIPLGTWFPEESRSLLLCVTEANTREEIDALVGAMGEVL